MLGSEYSDEELIVDNEQTTKEDDSPSKEIISALSNTSYEVRKEAKGRLVTLPSQRPVKIGAMAKFEKIVGKQRAAELLTEFESNEGEGNNFTVTA